MKSKLLVPFITLAFLSACGGSGGGNSEKNPTNNSPKEHLSTECPTFNGSFSFKEDGKTHIKRISMSKSAEGSLEIDDSGSKWIVDGKSHMRPSGDIKVLYKGSCSKNVLTIELFEGSTVLGQMEYRWLNEDEILIESKNSDPRLGPPSLEGTIWRKDF